MKKLLAPAIIVILSVSILIILLLSPVPAEETVVKKYPVPRDGFIQLEVPKSWQDSIKSYPELPKDIITIQFKPRNGDDFIVLMSVWLRQRPLGSDELKRMVGDRIKTNFPTFEEKSISMESIQGDFGTGFMYKAIDKNLEERMRKFEDYRHIIGGLLSANDLIMSFSIYTHERELPVRQEALSIIKQARKITSQQ